jgi:hypothetical protein
VAEGAPSSAGCSGVGLRLPAGAGGTAPVRRANAFRTSPSSVLVLLPPAARSAASPAAAFPTSAANASTRYISVTSHACVASLPLPCRRMNRPLRELLLATVRPRPLPPAFLGATVVVSAFGVARLYCRAPSSALVEGRYRLPFGDGMLSAKFGAPF